jgi:hypothetical protein
VRKGGAVTGEIRLVLPLVLMLCIRLVPVAPAQEALLPAPWALLAAWAEVARRAGSIIRVGAQETQDMSVKFSTTKVSTSPLRSP